MPLNRTRRSHVRALRPMSLPLPMAVGVPLQYLGTFNYGANPLIFTCIGQDRRPGRERGIRHLLARIGYEIGQVCRRTAVGAF